MLHRISLLSGLILMLVALTGCQCPHAHDGVISPALVNHPVFFKLNDPADADALLADCDRTLPAIDGVVAYYSGRHLDIGRENVISDYDVGIYVGFDSVESYRAYVDDPAHVRLVQRWGPKCEWIRVYDVLDSSRAR